VEPTPMTRTQRRVLRRLLSVSISCIPLSFVSAHPERRIGQ
jgi:hypothetical protein